jgi:hypothetical protein
LPTDDDSPYIAQRARRIACRIDGLRRRRDGHLRQENPMLRSISLLLMLPLVLGVSGVCAQTKKPPTAAKMPAATDNSIGVHVYLRDAAKNEVLLGTRIWPGYPDYNTVALRRFFEVMKALEPAYKQDDEVAYTWSTKGRVTKCSIYLESAEAGVRNGTGAIVGCEANGVSSVAATSVADPKRPVSSSQDPRHLNDVMDLFKKQSERARSSLPKQ